MAARAECLVTGNLKHFEELRGPEGEPLTHGGVRIVSPRASLDVLKKRLPGDRPFRDALDAVGA